MNAHARKIRQAFAITKAARRAAATRKRIAMAEKEQRIARAAFAAWLASHAAKAADHPPTEAGAESPT